MRDCLLAEVVDFKRQSIIPENIADGTKYVGLEHVFPDGRIDSQLVNNGDLASNKFIFSHHHILYGKLRPYLRKIAIPNFEGICSTDILPLLPVKDKIDKRYLYYFLRTPFMVEYATSRCSGANLPRISPKEIASFKIPLPPLPQQKKIAAILDAADAYRQQTRALIGKYEELSQSLFLEMFGDPVRNEKGWEKVKVEDISAKHKGSMRTGPFGSNLLHSEFVDEGIPVLGIDNAVLNKFQWKERRYITEEKYQELKRYTVFPDDIIITIMGTVGRVAGIVPKDIGIAINTKHLAAITTNKSLANPQFLAFSLHSDPHVLRQIKSQGKGAIMTGLNLTIIKGFKLYLPPLSLQNQFAERIQAIEAQKAQAEASLAQAEDLFQALLQKAFKGELE